MKTLTVGFSKPKSKYAIGGSLIRWYQGTEYSHCYIKFEVISGPTLISQASKGMLNYMSPAAFDLHNVIVKEFQIQVPDEAFTKIKIMSMEKAGLPYSMIQLVGIVIADLFKLKKNPLDRNTDTFVCSEWVGQVLETIGADIEKDLSLLSPKDIYQYLEKTHGNIV